MDRTCEYSDAVSDRGGSLVAPPEPANQTNLDLAFTKSMDSLRRRVRELERGVVRLEEQNSGLAFRASKTHKDLEQEQERTRTDIQSSHKLLDQLQWDAKGMAGQLKPMERAHVQGMLLIESERLAEVAKRFDRARGRKIRHVHKRRPAGEANVHNVTSRWNVLQEEGGKEEKQEHLSLAWEEQQQAPSLATTAKTALFEELEMARDAHRAVVQISSLNHLFSTEVVRQTHQIEAMYEDALAATQNFQVANVHLQKTIERSSGSQCYVFLFFVAASLALLFLDWLSG